MDCKSYIDKLKKKFERHFIIETDLEILGTKIDMYARFTDVRGRTFITKQDVIDKYENHELCYIKGYKDVAVEDVTGFCEFLKNAVNEFVKPEADHMSTYVTGVMVADSINDSARREAESFSYSRVYQFYLKGWCDVRLVCVDLSNGSVITNKAAKKLKKVYQITP